MIDEIREACNETGKEDIAPDIPLRYVRALLAYHDAAEALAHGKGDFYDVLQAARKKLGDV